MRVPKTREKNINRYKLANKYLEKSKSPKKNQFNLIVRRSVDLCLNLYHHRVRKFNQT